MPVRWVTAFLDFPAASFDRGCAFWLAVTGCSLSPSRGASGEFATLVPRQGDALLRVQRVDRNVPGCHLDLHVDDAEATSRQAVALGAGVSRAQPGFIVMTSAGGLPFCLVTAGTDHEFERPPPQAWPGGHRSLVDQLCLDIPAASYPREGAFWESLMGWECRLGSRPEFEYLVRPAGMPLRLLLQRLARPDEGPVALTSTSPATMSRPRSSVIGGSERCSLPSRAGLPFATPLAWRTASPGGTRVRARCTRHNEAPQRP